jgi:hypothetical protein
MSTLVQPEFPVHSGIGPKYRAALARIAELQAEIARLRLQLAELRKENSL